MSTITSINNDTSFSYRGKTFPIPNGYSLDNVVKSISNKEPAFHFKNSSDHIESHGYINRHKIFDNIKSTKSVYVIQFNLGLISSNIVNEDFNFTIPEYVVNDKNIKIVIESLWCDILPSLDSSQANDELYYKIIFNTIYKYKLQKDKICIIGPYSNVSDIDGIEYINLSLFFYAPIVEVDFNKRISEIESITKKQYKILCLNRKPRRHRLKLFEYVYNNNLLQDNYHTFAVDKKEVKKFTSESYSFLDKLPYNTDFFIVPTFAEWQSSQINRPTNKSYVDFVTETRFQEDVVIHTEKISIPIRNLQPFVYVGTPGSLNELQKQGYKTFDKWWSEEYDNIVDNEKRLQVICELYKEMSQWSHKEWSNIVYEMKNTLIHNYNLFKENNTHKHIHKDINNYVEKINLDK